MPRFLIGTMALVAAAMMFSAAAAQKHPHGIGKAGCPGGHCGVGTCGPMGCYGCTPHGCGFMQYQHVPHWYKHYSMLASRPYPGSPKFGDAWADQVAAITPWHAPYYNTAYGQPVALVVNPRASTQTHWNWGVAGTRISPLYHRFARPDFGGVPMQQAGSEGGGQLLPTPRWPSSTDQFGVYYVRGPWR